MKTMCWTALTLASLLFVGTEGFAAPAGKNNKKRGATVFTGVVTAVHHANGKRTITVAGRNHSGKRRKNKAAQANAGKARKKGNVAQANAGKRKGKRQGHTMTFHIGPQTKFMGGGNKGGNAANMSHIKVGTHVAVTHHGNNAQEVRVVHHQGGKKKNKANNAGKKKNKAKKVVKK